jgi:hypothetical protein
MATLCRAYGTEDEARAAVDRLLAAGATDAEIRVIMGTPGHDHRDEPVGRFAGMGERVGAFAGAGGSSHDAMGSFAGDGDQRRGGFGDLDRETVTTYRDGVRRVQVASHRKLERMLVEAGLEADVAAADVDALHAGRVLVLVRASSIDAGDAMGALDAA